MHGRTALNYARAFQHDQPIHDIRVIDDSLNFHGPIFSGGQFLAAYFQSSRSELN